MTAANALRRLVGVLSELGPVAPAVSGGVDSTTLAAVAHRHAGPVTVFHAVSAAVPAAATERVGRHARREGWDLRLIDAGELDDPDYVANPVDRCFHCKRNLYDAVRAHTDAVIVSGANTDDLDDYRPGLDAAAAASVVHPLVEAGIDKAGVRALAAHLGLTDLSELPASPCLSSRVETGIPIRPRWLTVIEEVEARLTGELAPELVRCRLRGDRVAVELDGHTLAGLDADTRRRLSAAVARRWAEVGVDRPVAFEPYRRGGAFVGVRP